MTHLIGQVRDNMPLLVTAFEQKAKFLGTDHPILITGIGKVNTAIGLTQTLAASTARPSVIIALGTAGALSNERGGGLHVVSEVIQHDLDSGPLESMTGQVYGAPIELSDRTGVTLATGDTFIADSRVRAKLAHRAALVDLCGYSLAAAANAFHIPIRIVKYVSDNADESAMLTWGGAMEYAAWHMAGWVRAHVH